MGASRFGVAVFCLVWATAAEVFGFELIDTLCEAARRGVSVNVAVNDLWFKQKGWYLTGAFDRHFDRAIKKGRCQDANGKKLRYVRGIAWYRPGDFVIGRYDHRKVWIIDGEVAYVGGYTVSDEMRDNMFDAEWVLKGPVVAQLQANFLLGLGHAKAPLADFTECRSELNVVSADPELIERVNREFFLVGGSKECAETLRFRREEKDSSRATPGPEHGICKVSSLTKE